MPAKGKIMPEKDWRSAPASERARQVVAILKQHYEPDCALRFNHPFELLIATILSAQCTDERVNQVTPALFAQYPDASALAQAAPAEVEELVRSTGFFRQKTKSIIAVSQAIVERHGGKVPETMEELSALPGVGRKTANVVLGTAFGKPAIMVDTHMKRVANLLQFTRQSNPDKIEQDLLALIPPQEQSGFSHRLIWHGRKVCIARRPRCGECVIAACCPSSAASGDH
jgi:endonuclease-3